jgi:TP901 family phage tail tape measure protein
VAVKVTVYGEAKLEQIERAQTELKKLEDAARQSQSGFAGSMTRLGGTLESAGQKMTNFGKGMTMGVTLPIVGIGAAAIAASTQFNQGMANVATLIPGNVERVNELKTSVQEMAVEVGKSTTDLSDGLYQVISAFGDTADTTAILETNARAAAAGLASTTDAINLTSGITKAYGDTSAEAVQKASDLALMTVRLGQTTFPELAASMGKVTPIAQSLGQSQEELFATFATLTGVTGGAAEVSTQYRGILAALSNPTAELTSLLESQGFASGQAALEQLGMVDTLKLITGAADETGQPLAKYIASIEAQPAVLALAGAQADAYQEKLTAMAGASGTTDQAFAEMTEGVNATGFQMEQARIKAEVMAQQLGDGLAPSLVILMDMLAPLVDKVIGLADSFANADPATQKMIGIALAAVAAIGPLAMVIGHVTTAVGGLIKILPLLGKALTLGLGPVGWIITAVGALVAGLVWFFTQTETGRELWARFWEFLKGVWEQMKLGWEIVVNGFKSLGEWFVNLPTMLGEIFAAAGEWLLSAGQAILQGLWNGILFVWEGIKFWYTDMPMMIIGLLATAGTWLLETGKSILNGMWEGLKLIWSGIQWWYRDMPRVILGLLATAGTWLIQTGRNIITGLWNGIKAIWASVTAWFGTLKDVVLGFWKGVGTWLLNAGQDMFQGLWDGMKRMAQRVWDWLTSWIGSLVNQAKKLLGIRSPSTVFRSIGEDMGIGLELGLKSMEGLVSRAAMGLAEAATMTASSTIALGTEQATAMLTAPAPAFATAGRGAVVSNVTIAPGAVQITFEGATDSADAQRVVEDAFAKLIRELRAS